MKKKKLTPRRREGISPAPGEKKKKVADRFFEEASDDASDNRNIGGRSSSDGGRQKKRPPSSQQQKYEKEEEETSQQNKTPSKKKPRGRPKKQPAETESGCDDVNQTANRRTTAEPITIVPESASQSSPTIMKTCRCFCRDNDDNDNDGQSSDNEEEASLRKLRQRIHTIQSVFPDHNNFFFFF